MSTLGAIAFAILIAALFVGAWRSPPSCLAALYCMFPIKQLGQSSIGIIQSHSALTNVLIGAVVLTSLFRLRSSLPQRIALDPRSLLLAVSLYVYALCSTTWTLAPDTALKSWGAAWPYLITSVLLTPLAVLNVPEMRTSIRWLTWIGGLTCLVMLFAGEWGSRGLIIAGESGEFESNPLAIAAMAGTTAIAALLQRPATGKKLDRLAAAAAAISALLLIIRSGSRGELIAALIAIAAVSPLRFRITKLRDVVAAAVVASIVAAVLVVGLASYKGGGDERWTQGNVSADTTGRFEMAGKLLNAWTRSGTSIVFGLGNSASFDSKVVGYYPHVMPAEILGEEGLIGAGIFALLVLGAIRSASRLWKARNLYTEGHDTIAIAIALAIFSFVVASKEGSLLGNYILFTALINLSRISKASTIPCERTDQYPEKPIQRSGPRFSNLMQ